MSGRPAASGRALLLALVGLAAALLAAPARADVYLQVGGASQAAPEIALAVPPFIAGAPYNAESAKAAKGVEDVVLDDLLFSRYFKIMQNGAAWTGNNLIAAVADWKTRGAAWLLTARATAVKSEVSVVVQLADTQSGTVEFSRVYRQQAPYERSLAHKISDDVVHDLTGKKGIAESEIAFANDSTGHKEIYLMDYDGANLRRMTWDRSICLLPRFSPDKSLLVFTSYRDGNPDLFGINLATGRREVVSDSQGLNVAGGFSPDGTKLLLTMSRERTPSIYMKDLADGTLTRLTENFGTDSSPTFSPDGAQVAFVSDVSGNPEI
ncbi:MAG: PD40 domain-containing protein, partial [Elusimicrobia bacterium]|nr:PD40 domain-containing protein [Elusimicrobiota bacterium]